VFAVIFALALIRTPDTISVTVDGVNRTALVYQPSGTAPNPPVVFGYHGHGGNARNASRSFDLQSAWPEALVVYPQGVPTKSRVDPSGALNGWSADTTEANPDIKFFDALFSKVMADYHGDSHRVFAMGHSNGGLFMYILWSLRAGKFAAFGSCEGAGALTVTLTPKPFFITIGDEDKIVSPALQHRSLNAVFKVNGSASSGTPFGDKGTLYKGAQPVVYWAYHGGHTFPADSVPTMMRFFQSCVDDSGGSKSL
jgi:polyhydroxybutyrate depolymerase